MSCWETCVIIRTISCRSLINCSKQLWVHGKLGKLDGRWRVFHTSLLPLLHSLSYCIVIIKDPTKPAFSPKAQVYMRAHTWSCSSSPLDKYIMASILIHSPEVLGPPLPPTTAFPRISQLESHSTYIDFT